MKYTKRTPKQEKRKKEKTPAKPKNRRKPKHPNRNQPTKLRDHYITERVLLLLTWLEPKPLAL
jgi:hypothetical protein